MSANNLVTLPDYGAARTFIQVAGEPTPDQLRRSRWQHRGSCADQDTEAWFVLTEGSQSAQPAKQVCWTCPVRRDCLASSLVFGEEYGIWGGLDRHQRNNLTQQLRVGATLGVVLDQALGARAGRMDAA